MGKNFFSLCMALVLCLSLLPATALAATVENITYLDKNGTQQTAASATQVTNSDTQWTDGWYVAQSNITIDGTVTISGNVHLILEDGCNLTVNGGILLAKGSNMYIYAPVSYTHLTCISYREVNNRPQCIPRGSRSSYGCHPYPKTE